MPASRINFLEELRWRDLLYQATDEAGLERWLSDPDDHPRKAYAGFDPTSDSLTIGNLVPIMALRHFQRAGHQPIVVMGGGTGLIGDPSGKSAERQLMSEEQVAANVQSQRRIFEQLLGTDGRPAMILNNLDWLRRLGYLEVLRDIGKHFSVNMMIQKDSVRDRLHARDQGISYTEFSYMILQAYDFLRLFQEQGITVQLGGSDQWGNIVAGVDLIRRVAAAQVSGRRHAEGAQWTAIPTPDTLANAADAADRDLADEIRSSSTSFGFTVPLITKADGGKFGKTESGAIWLTADRTSPYAYYQFWRNTSDADVVRYLKIFTLLPRDRIDELAAAHAANPGAADGQKTLAREATALLHGPDAAAQAEKASLALFSGDIAGLPESLLEEVFASVPSTEHSRDQLAGPGVPILELLAQTSLVKSKSEARQHLHSGAVSINGRTVDLAHTLTASDLLHGRLIALRRGKKAWHLTRWR
jgi:tyrosyl-tRNA synthetase